MKHFVLSDSRSFSSWAHMRGFFDYLFAISDEALEARADEREIMFTSGVEICRSDISDEREIALRKMTVDTIFQNLHACSEIEDDLRVVRTCEVYLDEFASVEDRKSISQFLDLFVPKSDEVRRQYGLDSVIAVTELPLDETPFVHIVFVADKEDAYKQFFHDCFVV